MTASPRRRLLAFAAGATMVVGVLAGLLFQMVVPIEYSRSLPEAKVGRMVLLGLLVVLLALYVALPVCAAAILARENDHPFAHGGVAAAAVLVPILTPLALWWAFHRSHGVADFYPRLVAAAGAFVAVLGGGALATRRIGPSTSQTGWIFGLNLAVLSLFLVGVIGTGVLAPGFGERHTTDVQPDVDLVFEERTTDDGRLLVIEHAGGDPAPVDRLDIRGDGFADVEGADQTAPGPWAGEASGQAPRGGGPAVVEGDTVTVGVTDDCALVIGEGAELHGPIEYYDCSES